MTSAHVRAAIEKTAASHGLEADLVEALVLTESGGNPFAWNPEPRYRYVVHPRTGRPWTVTSDDAAGKFPPVGFPALAGDPDNEWWGQQASWGLMQVMGALAREQGFREPYLPALCDVVTNLQIGCRHLAALLTWAKGDVDRALRAYNGGRGGADSPATAPYPVKVRGFLNQIKGGRG